MVGAGHSACQAHVYATQGLGHLGQKGFALWGSHRNIRLLTRLQVCLFIVESLHLSHFWLKFVFSVLNSV